jgi:hypothetical protein
MQSRPAPQLDHVDIKPRPKGRLWVGLSRSTEVAGPSQTDEKPTLGAAQNRFAAAVPGQDTGAAGQAAAAAAAIPITHYEPVTPKNGGIL